MREQSGRVPNVVVLFVSIKAAVIVVVSSKINNSNYFLKSLRVDVCSGKINK
ncbi:hypothetical protein [Methanolobus sp. ZRKC5]|uniref:hypothetical protein n=1 Tax=unclassified Methanolobus TaxID=2629569 RepID=UPI00313D3FBE